MKKQLQILPNPSELSKSYFPSWKMIEDALHPQSLRRQSFIDATDDDQTPSVELCAYTVVICAVFHHHIVIYIL